MQHQAYLSRSSFETGAALVIAGNRLASHDSLQVELSDGQVVVAVVAAFGLGRLHLTTGSQLLELLPWISGQDEPPDAKTAPVSRWTIRSIRRV